ncbi:WD repeat-containing protein 44 isoform X2 [Folsomia candida]|uniref:WD repeat-containing protein 44 isoform X2 n=1 Tax=Folsomia candida TaxID=158441 RepID=UPI00160528F9|nr:WD repeat-containing protein 44 isoform X2 [Folsomia candida]
MSRGGESSTGNSNSSTTTTSSSSDESESSSSEEFFDAEEPNTGTLIRFSKKILESPPNRVDLTTLTPAEIDSCSSANDLFFVTPPQSSSINNSGTLNASSVSMASILSRSEMEEEAEDERRRKRLEEARRRLNNDEVEGDEQTSPSDSQTSSVEGLYGAISGKNSHPFKVVDHDNVSLQSGVSSGRVGRPGTTSSVMAVNNFGYSTSINNNSSYHLPPQQPYIPSSPSISASSSPSSNSNSNTFLATIQQSLPNSQLNNASSSSDNSVHQVPLSQNSSSHGFVFSGNTTASETSKVGNGNLTRSGNSNPKNYNNALPLLTMAMAPEPDLVASCLAKEKVSSELGDSGAAGESPVVRQLQTMPAPVAPPRRKRRGIGALGKTQSEDGDDSSSRDVTPLRESPPSPFPPPTEVNNFPPPRPTSSSSRQNSSAVMSPKNPPSPTVSIRSVCRELDKTLETAQRIYVVKAQDEEKTRAKNSGPRALRRTESLPKDVIAAFDQSGSHRDKTLTNVVVVNTSTSNINSASAVVPNSGVEVEKVETAPSSQQDKKKPNDKRHSLSSSEKSLKIGATHSRSNSAPKSGSIKLSSLVSALAAREERKEMDGAGGLAQFNMIRTRTDSGKLLSDIEILEQVERPKSLDLHFHPVLNLDTGERVPLSIAEDKIPQCINPLSLHIMRLTSEYVGQRSSSNDRDSDEESLDSKKSSAASQDDAETSGVKKKTAQVRRFLGSTVKKTVNKAKSLAQRRHVKEDVDISTNEDILGQDPLLKMKASHSHKGPYDFDHLQQVQELFGEHVGPVWCMKFSNCGRLLATAGQDKVIRIWVLKDHLPYFQDMRTKNTTDKVSPTPSQESIVSQHSHHSAEEMLQACENSDPRSPFVPRPLCTYSGHTADLLDIAWSKSFFVLSSSMDRTVRLWHISRRECLCCFQHIDFVTAIAFHPRDDRYFLSGSLDGKLRLWNIPDKKVALWNEVNGPNNLITAANFCQNGKFAVVGTYDGRCIFYHTEQLKYHTQIIVHRRKRMTGRKITGIEPMPGEDKILVTSNDSRIRLYDLRDLSLTCKYRGFTNSSSQIKGTVSHDGKYIVSGSENQCVYIWRTNHDYSKFSSARRDRNGYWEGIKAHNAVVTSAAFAPDPDIIVKQIEKLEEQPSSSSESEKKQQGAMVKSPSLTKSYSHQQHSSPSSPAGYVLVSADFSGCIKVFFSKVKPKHSSLPASALI